MKLTFAAFSIATATGALAHALWGASVKGTLLLIVAMLVLLAFRRISSAVRHLTLVAAVASFVFIPLLSWALPSWQILPSSTTGELAGIDSAPVSASSLVPVQITPVTAPIETDSSPSTLGTPKDASRSWPSPNLVLTIWVAGSSIILVRLVTSRARLCALEAAAVPCLDKQLLGTVEQLMRRLHLTQPVDILIGERDAMPMTWGLRRARLLLPSGCESWDRPRLESVLLHELAHIKRRDVATQLLVQCVCAVFWFNPAVWLAAWRIRIERELACDDLVLGSGVSAPDYAESLLSIVTGCEICPRLRNTSIAMADRVRIEGRLQSILNDRLNRHPVTRRSAALAGVAFAVAVLPIAMLQADERKELEATPAPPVAPVPPVAPELVDNSMAVSQIFDLRHVNVDEVRKAIVELIELSNDGADNRLTSDARLNRLFVTGADDFRSQVQTLVGILDRPEAGLSGESDTALAQLLKQLVEARKTRTNKHPKVKALLKVIKDELQKSPDAIAGIGCMLRSDDNTPGCLISLIVDDGPAARAGLKVGDRILGIAEGNDGLLVDVRKMPVDEVSKMCRGTKGTQIRLLIMPAGAEDGIRREIAITRDALGVTLP